MLGSQNWAAGAVSRGSASPGRRVVVSWSQLHFRERHREPKALPVVPAHSLERGFQESKSDMPLWGDASRNQLTLFSPLPGAFVAFDCKELWLNPT